MLITSVKTHNKREIIRSFNSVKPEKNINRFSSNSTSINSFPSSLIRGAYGVLPSREGNNAKNVSFSSNPLYNINLKKLMPNNKYEFVQASFSQLMIKDKKDVDSIFELKKLWGDETEYGEYIANDFLQNSSSREAFFVTEIIDTSLKMADRITCIIQASNPKKSKTKGVLDISFLQSSPDVVGKKHPKFKGSGELSLYCLVKLAKENDFKRIRLVSFNNGFYKKMKFKKVSKPGSKVCVFELPMSKFDSFIRRVSKKYKIEDSLIQNSKKNNHVF